MGGFTLEDGTDRTDRPKILLLCPVFRTVSLTENIESRYEMYSVLLPVYAVAMALKAMCKYFGSFLDAIWI